MHFVKIIIFTLTMSGLSACTSEAVYTNLARHQCYQDAQAQQRNDIANCQLEEKVDGMTYEEYLRQREE